MSKSEKKLMKDHEYDGIHELDNDLPNWWVALFIFTVIIGGVYLTYYWMDMGPGQAEEYVTELKAHEAKMERLKKAKEAEEARQIGLVDKVVEKAADAKAETK